MVIFLFEYRWQHVYHTTQGWQQMVVMHIIIRLLCSTRDIYPQEHNICHSFWGWPQSFDQFIKMMIKAKKRKSQLIDIGNRKVFYWKWTENSLRMVWSLKRKGGLLTSETGKFALNVTVFALIVAKLGHRHFFYYFESKVERLR